MDITQSLFLTGKEKFKLYNYLENQRLLFAFHYHQLFELAQQIQINKSDYDFKYIQDHEFNNIHQTANNCLFFQNCPKLLYMTDKEIKIQDPIKPSQKSIEKPKQVQPLLLENIPDRSLLLREAEV